MRQCKKCKNNKDIIDFSSNKSKPDGINYWCKSCHKIYHHQNRKKILERKRQYGIINADTIKEKDRLRRERDSVKRAKHLRLYYSENKDKYSAYRKTNAEKIKLQTKKYNARPEVIKKRRDRMRVRYTTDLKVNLTIRITTGMNQTLRHGKQNKTWLKLVDFTLNQLRAHLEKQFKDGMTWERFLKGEIHIDHITPISAFNFSSPEHIDFKRCWALSNLQPLWAKDNLSKKDKIQKPFQPTLKIARREADNG